MFGPSLLSALLPSSMGRLASADPLPRPAAPSPTPLASLTTSAAASAFARATSSRSTASAVVPGRLSLAKQCAQIKNLIGGFLSYHDCAAAVVTCREMRMDRAKIDAVVRGSWDEIVTFIDGLGRNWSSDPAGITKATFDRFLAVADPALLELFVWEIGKRGRTTPSIIAALNAWIPETFTTRQPSLARVLRLIDAFMRQGIDPLHCNRISFPVIIDVPLCILAELAAQDTPCQEELRNAFGVALLDPLHWGTRRGNLAISAFFAIATISAQHRLCKAVRLKVQMGEIYNQYRAHFLAHIPRRTCQLNLHALCVYQRSSLLSDKTLRILLNRCRHLTHLEFAVSSASQLTILAAHWPPHIHSLAIYSMVTQVGSKFIPAFRTLVSAPWFLPTTIKLCDSLSGKRRYDDVIGIIAKRAQAMRLRSLSIRASLKFNAIKPLLKRTAYGRKDDREFRDLKSLEFIDCFDSFKVSVKAKQKLEWFYSFSTDDFLIWRNDYPTCRIILHEPNIYGDPKPVYLH